MVGAEFGRLVANRFPTAPGRLGRKPASPPPGAIDRSEHIDAMTGFLDPAIRFHMDDVPGSLEISEGNGTRPQQRQARIRASNRRQTARSGPPRRRSWPEGPTARRERRSAGALLWLPDEYRVVRVTPDGPQPNDPISQEPHSKIEARSHQRNHHQERQRRQRLARRPEEHGIRNHHEHPDG